MAAALEMEATKYDVAPMVAVHELASALAEL